MKEQILAYQASVQEEMQKELSREDWEALRQDYLIKIGFYQHERLIHLIVTITFALLEMLAIATLIISQEIAVTALAGIIMVLLIPYIGHYYFLENEVQRMYKIYETIRRNAENPSKA